MKIEIKVDMHELKELSGSLSGGKVKEAIDRGVKAGAMLVRSTAQRKILSGPKSGKTYKRRGISHQASAPGEPPASDTGRLVQGIVVQPAPEAFAYDVKSLADYAGFLEYGTSRMSARPYLEPSAHEQADNIAKLIADALEI